MVETYCNPAFEDRKSQNLTFMDYAKKTLFWAALPVIAGATTFGLGRLTKYKIFPLDGSPMLLNSIYEKLFLKATNFKGEINEVDRLIAYTGWLPPEKRLQATHDIWNFMKGTEIAAIPVAYHFWRNKEAERLDLLPMQQRLQQLNDLKPTDVELAQENASLRQQLEFVTNSPSTQVSASVHKGPLKDAVIEAGQSK